MGSNGGERFGVERARVWGGREMRAYIDMQLGSALTRQIVADSVAVNSTLLPAKARQRDINWISERLQAAASRASMGYA